jgi:hypothetical protein
MKQVILALLAAPEYVNPAIALAVEMQEAETRGDTAAVDELIRSVKVAHAILDGEHEGRAVIEALAACGHAVPRESKSVPVGF